MASSYDFRDRRWCMGSNSVPSTNERDEALSNERKFQCQECGRRVMMTRTGLVPTHLSTAPKRAPA